MSGLDESWDLFLSHAHEDKQEIARPLALALMRRGARVWYDEFSLRLGDSLRKSIDLGLAKSRFGVVILSPSFFAKRWTDSEFAALYGRQHSGSENIIIPIWHKVTKQEVQQYSPMLADLVAIPTTLPLVDIADRILGNLHVGSAKIDLSKVAPTGVPGLDRALGGGLPRRSSIVLKGPKGIGKTTLALQVQLAALDRGEPCLYVSYREAPRDILCHMLKMGAPVQDYVAKRRFMILDNFSAPNGITAEDVQASIPEAFQPAVIRVENPADREGYYKMQVDVMEKLGMGGVNVIDSVNERYRMMKNEPELDRTTGVYFQRFRTRLARLGGQSALHLATDIPKEDRFNNLLKDLEDGEITMRLQRGSGERRRYLRIQSLRDTWHDDRWLEFTITADGIRLLG